MTVSRRRDRDGELLEVDEPAGAEELHPLGCRDGWLGEDGTGRPVPCPDCRPHVARGRRRLREVTR